MRRTDVRPVPTLLAGLTAAVLLGGAPAPVAAQQAADSTARPAADSAAATSAADSVPTYRREVFHFPSGRKSPFEPVRAGEDLGPRFEDLTLSGVVYNQSLGSVAVLVDRTTGKRYRVHEGERVGQARVARIRPDEVSFVVSGFGQSRTEVLRVKKQDKETSG